VYLLYKVTIMVTLYSKYTRALTFENLLPENYKALLRRYSSRHLGTAGHE
jgi:hypothetical protein